jgi:hypothetical protein
VKFTNQMLEVHPEAGGFDVNVPQPLTPVTKELDLFHEEPKTFAENLLEHPKNRC